MDIHMILDRLNEARVSVWLDDAGNLRITKGADDEIKQLVREHRQLLIDLRQAQQFMDQAGIRIQRLPLGELALRYPPGTDTNLLQRAAATLQMDDLPLVVLLP
jgi:hypothetical protein